MRLESGRPWQHSEIRVGERIVLVGALMVTTGCAPIISKDNQSTPTTKAYPTFSPSSEPSETSTFIPSPRPTSTPTPTEIATPAPEYVIGGEEIGISGTALFYDISRTTGEPILSFDKVGEFLEPLSLDKTAPLRFRDESGNFYPYGEIFLSQSLGDYDKNIAVHMRFRGLIDIAPMASVNKVAVFDIPFEEVNPVSGKLDETSRREVVLVLLPDQANGGAYLYSIKDENIEGLKRGYSSFHNMIDILSNLPEGTSVLVGLQIELDPSEHPPSFIDEQNEFLEGLKDKKPVTGPVFYVIVGLGVDTIYIR